MRVLPVRDARVSDLPYLTDLALQAREESGLGGQICSDDRDRVQGQFGATLQLPGCRVLVPDEDEPSGMLMLRVLEPGPFTPDVNVFIDAIFVTANARRRGIGQSLLLAAAVAADEAGAEYVFSVPIPGSRGVQRFLARLGFAPAAGHRSVSTAHLLRQLTADAHDVPDARRHRRGSIEALIAKRRSARQEAQANRQSA